LVETNHPTVASLLSEPDALLIKDELPRRIAHRRTVSRPPGLLARQMNAFVVGRLDKELIQHLLEGFFSRPIGRRHGVKIDR
jgi:hypothetical protein